MFTEQQEAELLSNVKSITDRLNLVDEIFKAHKMGREVTLAFQCGHSGLYLPPDYVKNWGKLYGIGLGPSPCSEVLDSEYDVDPPAITPDIESIEQIMHPLRTTFAQVDYMTVALDEYAAQQAILVKDDPKMKARARIVRSKQLANSRGKLRLMHTAWLQAERRG